MIHPTRRVYLTCAVWCGTRMCAWDCGAVVACRVLRCGIIGGIVFERKENKFMFIVIYAVIVTVLFIISLNA